MNLRFLYQRGEIWWYTRRVPSEFAHVDPRGRIRISLNTDSKEHACKLRDGLVEADKIYWSSLVTLNANGELSEVQNAAAQVRYADAKTRALSKGYEYRPQQSLVENAPLEELVARLEAIDKGASASGIPKVADAEALLGGAQEPKVLISDALEVYFDEIAVDDQIYKSDHQKYQWRKVKKRSIAYLTDLIGDIPISEVTRDHALRFKKYWIDRIEGADGAAVSASTANRHIGNARALHREYYKHLGEENRENPFKNISFKAKSKTEVPAFEVSWLKERFLKPGMFKGLRAELQLITFIMIETGCRPSEIINVRPKDIVLDSAVPFLRIAARTHGEKKREIKTATSERDIPLTGVSLEAAKRAVGAFPHYYDRNELFSANLMKAFRSRELFPTKAHRVYSIRHSFEKRMQEANLDYGLRCLLMGHKTGRPDYGDGGSMKYRQCEIKKIQLPFDMKIFEVFDEEHPDWAPPR